MGSAPSDTINVSRLTVIQAMFSHYGREFIILSSLAYLSLDSEFHNSVAARRTDKGNSAKETKIANSKDKNFHNGVVCKCLFSCLV